MNLVAKCTCLSGKKKKNVIKKFKTRQQNESLQKTLHGRSMRAMTCNNMNPSWDNLFCLPFCAQWPTRHLKPDLPWGTLCCSLRRSPPSHRDGGRRRSSWAVLLALRWFRRLQTPECITPSSSVPVLKGCWVWATRFSDRTRWLMDRMMDSEVRERMRVQMWRRRGREKNKTKQQLFSGRVESQAWLQHTALPVFTPSTML